MSEERRRGGSAGRDDALRPEPEPETEPACERGILVMLTSSLSIPCDGNCPLVLTNPPSCLFVIG